jgi:hypothetical protein
MTDEEEIEQYSCINPTCPNFSADGYIYCESHIHGFPRRMPDHLIKLKEKMRKQKLQCLS